jgi:hypothetical protein
MRAPVVCVSADVRTPAELWQEFREYPERFWDNRNNKRNPRAPDYTHKDSGDAIWLSRPPGSTAAGDSTGAGGYNSNGFAAAASNATSSAPSSFTSAGQVYGSDYDAASSVSQPGADTSQGVPAMASRALLPPVALVAGSCFLGSCS